MSEFRDEHIPLAYLITFRAYGTWLHGDRRGSVDRFHNRFGCPLIAQNERWRKHNQSVLRQRPVKLKSRQRVLVEEAIREHVRFENGNFGQRTLDRTTFTRLFLHLVNQRRYSVLLKRTQRENCEKQVIGGQKEVRGLTAEARDICGPRATSSMLWFMSSMIKASNDRSG
jgi:hypothetical protein